MNSLAGELRLESGAAWLPETMPSDLELKVHNERLAGPVHGYYLACYAVETDLGFFHGYAKVYVDRPVSVWGLRPALAKYSAGPFDSKEQAIQGVVRKCNVELAQRETKANRLYRYLLKLL